MKNNKEVRRDFYLEKLWIEKDRDFIKVVTGTRRCGKSTLLEQFQRELHVAEGDRINIISINLERIEYDFLTDYKVLYYYIKERLVEDKNNYIFIDEIQGVKEFERAVDSLYVMKNIDIYITGSNSKMLSSEIATILTGRYIEIEMFPFSFKEFCSSNEISSRENMARYLEFGGFPAVAIESNDALASEAILSVFNTSVIKDVIERDPGIEERKLKLVIDFLFNNIGNLVSPHNIANTMVSNNEKLSHNTVDKYIRLLTESFTLYSAQRYDIKGKKLLKTQQKLYLVDHALRWATGSRVPKSDIGHALENIVYFELLRKFPRVWIGKVDDNEVDFMVSDERANVQYIQVALTALDEKTLARELKPFGKIRDTHTRILLTLDEIKPQNYDGIRHINAIDWLLGDLI